jgi:3-oxoacyl-[acyl-carrier-protein] synthase II
VEDLQHAQKRGARICAEVVGFGASFDRQRNGDGVARAMRAALREAGVGPVDLDHVNAHGLSSRDDDIWEARGIRQVLGDVSVPVLAIKSYTGNMGAAGGLTELTASLLGLQQGVVPATLNHVHPDPECPVQVLAEERRATRPHVLKVGFTQAGQCAAVVIRKWE